VLLQDALERLGRTVAIPGAIGVDDGDRASPTHAQAADLGPVDSAGFAIQTELAQPALEELPRLQCLLRRRAIAVDTQEDVAGIATDVETARERREGFRGSVRGRFRGDIGELGFHGRRV